MLIRNDSPVLEYDTAAEAVIMPNSDRAYEIPARCVFGFLGDEIDRFAQANELPVVAQYDSVTKIFPVYKMLYKGMELALCQAPCGAAPAAQLLDFLIGCGADRIIAVGGCGVLTDIEENRWLIPTEALRDEGTSYQYLPPTRTIDCDERAVRAIERALDMLGLPYTPVKTWTTDGFFRETREMVTYRIEEGCSVVEMECAALAACASFRDVQFGQLLFSCDTLADIERHDRRSWGAASFPAALVPAMEAVAFL